MDRGFYGRAGCDGFGEEFFRSRSGLGRVLVGVNLFQVGLQVELIDQEFLTGRVSDGII